MSNETYIYGDSNGAWYKAPSSDDPGFTHWDPRIEVRPIGGTVQVGIVPPSEEKSTGSHGVWEREDGQFLTLSRDGVNRLIRALRAARIEIHGEDA